MTRSTQIAVVAFSCVSWAAEAGDVPASQPSAAASRPAGTRGDEAPAGDGAGSPPEQHRPGKAVVPESASEGPRDAKLLAAALAKLVESQPYGRHWKDIVHVEPAPRDKTGLGEAKTHAALKNDPMELQQQVQYLEELGRDERYGHVSIRGVRVYRFGKLEATRLVFEMIGRGSREKFKEDVEALAGEWADPAKVLGLGAKLKVTRNDLVDQKQRRPAEFPAPPLVIELRPAERGAR